MANPFDEFDKSEDFVAIGTSPIAKKEEKEVNPFDEFDSPTSSDDSTSEQSTSTWDGLADTNMYEGVQTGEEAFKRYNQAKEDPRNANRIVPPPSMNLRRNIPIIGPYFYGDDPYTVGDIDKSAGYLANAGKNIAKTVTAIGDSIVNSTGKLLGQDWNNQGSKVVDENLSEMVPGTTTEEITNELVGAAVGALGGGAGATAAAGSALKGSYQYVPGIMKALVRETGGAAGAAASMDENTSTLLVGEGKLFKAAEVDGEFSEQLLAKKLNVMVDGIVLGMAAEGGVKAVSSGLSFLNKNIIQPIRGIANAEVGENKVFELMLDQVSGVENMKPEEQKQLIARVAKLVQENKDVILKSSKNEVEVTLDPLTAMERGLREEGNIAAADRVKAQRDAIFNKGYGQTITKNSEYGQSTGQFADNLYQEGGAAQGVEQAREGIVGAGQAEVAGLEETSQQAAMALQKARTDITETLKNDPTFGEQLQKLSNSSGVNIFEGTNNSVDQITNNIVAVEKKMNAQRAALYNAIPEGVMIDPIQFEKALKNVVGAPAERLLPKRLMAALEDPEADHLFDYKFLNNEVVPDLSTTISRLINSGTPESLQAAQTLKGLRKHIKEDQLGYLSKIARAKKAGSGQAKKVLDTIDAAREYEKVYQSYFSSGPLEKIKSAARDVVPGNVGEERTFMDTAGKQVEGAFGNKNRHSAQTMIELLSTPEGGQSAPLVTDYIIGKTARELTNTIQSKGLDNLSVDTIAKNLQNEAAVLYQNFPEQAQRVEQFIQQLRAQQGNIPALEQALKEADTIASEAKTQIFKRELGKFFDNMGRPVSDPQAIFNDIFSSPTATNTLNDIMTRAEQTANPELVKEGIRASFGKYLEFNPKFIENHGESLINYAQILFKDRPEVIEATQKAFNLISDTAIRHSPENMVNRVPMKILTQGSDALGRVITQVFGVLNRVGARVRSGSGMVIKSIDPAERVSLMIGKMYTDPEEFFRLAQQYSDSLGNSGKNTDAAYQFTNFLTKGTNFEVTSPEPPMPQEITNDDQPVPKEDILTFSTEPPSDDTTLAGENPDNPMNSDAPPLQ